jgi:hypothetical protein
MTRDDIIRMAREADLLVWALIPDDSVFVADLERFAALVAAAEQDRCCKIVYGMAGSDNVAQRTVDAIRGKE